MKCHPQQQEGNSVTGNNMEKFGTCELSKGKGGWIWFMCFLYMYKYGTLKLDQAIFKNEVKGNVWAKPEYLVHIYGNVKTNPLYNYYILVKMFKNRNFLSVLHDFYFISSKENKKETQ
jgi:hypothetical protein